MGAKQRGAKRGKKAAQGSMKGQPRSQKQLNQSILVPDLSPSSRSRSLQAWGNQYASSSAQPGFSMREEARHTDRQAHIRGDTSLRSKGISFVSAGPLKRDEDAWNTVSEGESPQKQSDAEEPDVAGKEDSKLDQSVAGPELPASFSQPQEEEKGIESETSKIKIEDTQPRPQPQPHSDSEEEIVFSGRALNSRVPSRRPTPAPAPVPTMSTTANPSLPPKPDTASGDIMSGDVGDKTVRSGKTVPVFAKTSAIGLDSPMDLPKSGKKSKRAKLPYGRRYDSDELMQDYIDNMALDDTTDEEEEESSGNRSKKKPFKKTETFRLFDGDGLENEKVQTNGKKKPPSYLLDQAIDWDSDDLADFDDISTTDEEVDDIAQVIRHRSRKSGVQYLVVAAGSDASDAKWMLHAHLVSDSAVKEIRIYEEIRTMNIEQDTYEDDSENDSEDDNETDESEEAAIQDLIDTIESEDDENARIMDYASRMTDEQIARALAKQEELGLGSDELMIFDGEAARGARSGGDGNTDDVFGDGDDFIPFNLGRHSSNRTRSKRNKKQRDSFPSAEAFADALDQDPYGAFDVMDFDRPSLKPKKKGRKSDFPWDLGDLDDDLREQLTNTWTKDREKKAERKRQREEARLAANLEAEDGSDPFVIKERIRRFLLSTTDTLELSPMGSEIRRSVHMLAKTLHLLSRSKGKDGIGAGRYPVLTKTPRTPYYNADTIWEVDTLLSSKKYFPKHIYGRSKKSPRTPGSARPRRMGGGGGVMSGATYRDGDEVGASAPEIGSDNRGRALLEKMGWVAGMAIGAENNKGSLDHVRHIVKTTKAGLG